MSGRIVAYFVLSRERVQLTVERVQRDEGLPLDVALRGVGAALCSATGPTHDVMRLIGGLAAEGEPALFSAENC